MRGKPHILGDFRPPLEPLAVVELENLDFVVIIIKAAIARVRKR